ATPSLWLDRHEPGPDNQAPWPDRCRHNHRRCRHGPRYCRQVVETLSPIIQQAGAFALAKCTSGREIGRCAPPSRWPRPIAVHPWPERSRFGPTKSTLERNEARLVADTEPTWGGTQLTWPDSDSTRASNGDSSLSEDPAKLPADATVAPVAGQPMMNQQS